MNNDEEALIRAIVDNPGDDTARLVYADWLDERDDPRGAYLRAELEWAKTGKQVRALRTLGKPLDAVWVYRVSRPPVGVCLRYRIFAADRDIKPLTRKEITSAEDEHGSFPKEYVAFLLNYNGGELVDKVFFDADENDGIEGFASLTQYLTLDELIENIRFPYVHEFDDGREIERVFYKLPRSRLPIGYLKTYGIGYYYDAVMLVSHKRGTQTSTRVEYYSNPLTNDIPCQDADNPRRRFSPLAQTFCVFLHTIDNVFAPDE